MPQSVRVKEATSNPTTPRELAYVPLHMIQATLKEREGMGEGVKEIPLGVYLASKLEFDTLRNGQVESKGKVITFKHEKLERGNWKLEWNESEPKTSKATRKPRAKKATKVKAKS